MINQNFPIMIITGVIKLGNVVIKVNFENKTKIEHNIEQSFVISMFVHYLS